MKAGINPSELFAGAVSSALSGFIAGELVNALGLKGDAARLLNSSTATLLNLPLGSFTRSVLVDGQSLSNSLDTAFSFNKGGGLSTVSTVASATTLAFNIAGAFLGQKIGSHVVPPETQNAAIVQSVFTAIGSNIGSAVPLIGTFIGSAIGSTLGGLLGNKLFPHQNPEAWGYVRYGADSAGFNRWFVEAKNGGNTVMAAAMADAATQVLNQVTALLGGTVRNPGELNSQYGHISTEYKTSSFRLPGFRYGNFDVHADTPEDAVRFGATTVIQHMELDNADPIMARAFYRSFTADIYQVGAALEIAVEYKKYLANKAVINALVQAAPDSNFAAGWGVTLQAAAALGLDDEKAIDHQMYARGWNQQRYGTDTLQVGGNGNYRLVGSIGADTLIGSDGNDELLGGESNDGLVGGGGNDRLIGDAGGDALYGNSGDDVLDGGSGSNLLDGGDGNDVADYSGSVAGVVVDLAAGGPNVIHYSWDGYTDSETGQFHKILIDEHDSVVNVECVIGTDFADQLYASNTSGTLVGRGGDDVLVGRGGDDVLIGGQGADWLDGGLGSNTAAYAGSPGGVRVDLSLGHGWGNDAEGDHLVSIQNLFGTGWDDVLFGDEGANILTGAMGNDTLDGRGGNDRLLGGGGDDALYGGGGADDLQGEEGNDLLVGEDGNDILRGGIGADNLQSGNGDDVLHGGTANDIMDGGPGFDVALFDAPAIRAVLYGPGRIAVASPDGTDRLSNVEAVQAGDGRRVNTGDLPAFDALGYVASYMDLANAFTGAGNPDAIADAGAAHWVEWGANEGRSQAFNGLQYIASNPAMAGYFAQLGSLETIRDAGAMHYLTQGRTTGLNTNAFDPYKYIASSPDLISWVHASSKTSTADVLQLGSYHYIEYGIAEHRLANFDVWSYLASNQDLIVGLHNGAYGLGQQDAAAYHYIFEGRGQGRALDSFDGTGYTASFEDLRNMARGGGLNTADAIERWATWHYVEHGFWEGRSSGNFDAGQYLRNYADLRTAFGTNTQAAAAHYVLNGSVEGRTTLPFGDVSDVISIKLAADSYGGDPLVYVEIDGRSMGSPMLVTPQHASGTDHETSFVVARGSGAHQIRLVFVNDRYDGPGRDRNAYVDGISVNGVTTPGAFAFVGSEGFTIQVAGPSTSPIRQAGPNLAIAKPSDLNGDGKSDTVWQHTGGTIVDWAMNGALVSSSTTVGGLGNEWRFLAAGDLNGDGKSDLLWQHVANGAVVDWTMNGSTIVQGDYVGTGTAGWTVLGVGDLNGDGKSDVLWRHESGLVHTWTMDGPRVAGNTDLGISDASWKFLTLADFNGDGKADVLWKNQTTGELVTWTTNSSMGHGTASLGSGASQLSFLGAADFNGDGKADLLWRDASGSVSEWGMDGAFVAAKTVLGTVDQDWNVRAMGDYNGDGKADVMWQHASGALVQWQMNGATVQSAAPLQSLDTSWKVLA